MIIRKLRLQQGWTQQELAQFSGLSIRTVQRIEKGQTPSEESAKCLGAVFEVDAADILEYFQTHGVATESSPKQEISVMTKLDVSYEEEKAMREVEDIKSFYLHATAYGVMIPLIWLFNAMDSSNVWWAIWPSIGWGIGLLGHGMSVYNPLKLFGPEWERKQIQKRLNKQG